MNARSRNENILELPRLVPILKSWWWVLSVAVIIGAGACYAVTKHAKPVYSASAEVLVSLTSPANPNGSYSDSQTALMAAVAVQDEVKTHRLADTVVRLARVPLSSDTVLGELQASASSDTPLVTITAQDTSADRAALLANTAASAVVALNQADSDAKYAALRAILQRQIASVNKQLDALGAHGAKSLGATSQLSSLQASLQSLIAQLNGLPLQQEQSDDMLSVLDSAQVPSSPVSSRLLANELIAIILSLVLAGSAIAGVEYYKDDRLSWAGAAAAPRRR